MPGSYDREVAAVECGQLAYAEPLGGGHDGGVDRSEGEIPIGTGQLGDSEPVGRHDGLGQEVSGGQVPEEPDLGFHTESSAEEVDDLGDDEDRNDQWSWMFLEEFEAFGMMPVVPIDVGIQGTGIDQEGYEATSARRILSICSETSDRPLRPAPAASSRRRPVPLAPRWASIASRVSSDTVVPRR